MVSVCGTADPEQLDAPEVTLATEPFDAHDVELLQLVYEVRAEHRRAMLPPALHPVNPPAITMTILRAGGSEAGPFTLAEIRIICRSGVRSRGFHLSCFVDGPDAARLLARHWGYRVATAQVELSRRYHGTTAFVRTADGIPLRARLLDPRPLSPGDVQLTDTMHLARIPAGRRLIQVERAVRPSEVDRGEPLLDTFDGAAFGEPRLVPSNPVSAVLLTGQAAFRLVRYVCRPDINALEGTERVG